MKKSNHAQFLYHRLGYSVSILGCKALKLVFQLTCRKCLGSVGRRFSDYLSNFYLLEKYQTCLLGLHKIYTLCRSEHLRS